MNLFVESQGRPRALWRLLVQFFIFQAATVFFAAPLTLAWSLAGAGGLRGATGSGRPSAIFLIGVVASMAAAFVSVWLAGRFVDRRPFKDFGFHFDGEWWLDLFFGLVLGALLMTGIFLTELAFGWVTVAGSFRSLSPGAPFALTILLPLVAFLFVGIYEELFSRGYQLRNMAEGFNYPLPGPRGAVLAAWGISSVLFGILHAFNRNADVVSVANIALAGLMLGTAYILTGELAVPIGLHIAWNFFQGNVFGFPVSGLSPLRVTFVVTEQSGPEVWTGGAFGPEGGLLVTFATLTGILLTVLWVWLRHGHTTIHTPLAEYPKQSSAPPEE